MKVHIPMLEYYYYLYNALKKN